MTVEGLAGSHAPFDDRIQQASRLPGQIDAARRIRALLASDSEIHHSHENCERVQDPYAVRCMPQVFGAVEHTVRHARDVLGAAINGVSDNPLIFGEDVLSGGNFHAEPIGFISDFLAIAVAELASTSERRIDLLDRRVNPNLNMFLTTEPGLESGFMIAHVTAAALVSENKTYAHPASVDSLPTSAGQEDHVSMAPWAGRKLGQDLRQHGARARASNCSPRPMHSIHCARSPPRLNCSACTTSCGRSCRTSRTTIASTATSPASRGWSIPASSHPSFRPAEPGTDMLGVIALCVAFGLLALLVSLSRWLAHRPWAAAGNLAVAVLLLLAAQQLWPPVLHLRTYENLRPKAADRPGPLRADRAERLPRHAHPAARGPDAGVRDGGRRVAPGRPHAGVDGSGCKAGAARPATGSTGSAAATCARNWPPRTRRRPPPATASPTADPARPRQLCPE